MEYFKQDDVKKLFYNKFVVVIGDSVQRGVYKDLIRLLTSSSSSMLALSHLKSKGEPSCCGDERIEWSGKTAGKWYREVRQYQTEHYLIRYYFITRCYSEYMETVLLDLAQEPTVDVLIMNSCLWDISRYGPTGIKTYKKNLQIIFSRLDDVLPKQCLFIWLTTLPVGQRITAPFITPDLSFLENILSIEVKEGNFYACQVAEEYGVEVIDLHWYFRHYIKLRKMDGVHWNDIAHRRITNFILTHICEAWNILPPSTFVPHKISGQLPSSYETKRRTHQRSLSMPDQSFIPTLMSKEVSCRHNNNNSQYFANLQKKQDVDEREAMFKSAQESVSKFNHVVNNGVFGKYQWPQQQEDLTGPVRSSKCYF